MIWIIVAIIFFLAAVILFSGSVAVRTRTREEYLEDLAKYVNGTMEKIDQFENSCRIKFNFEGYDFIYEDFEDAGFKGAIYKAYLRLATPTELTINFTEKKPKTTFRSKVILTSELSDETVSSKKKLKIPKELKKFNVHASMPDLVEMLFENKKFMKILCAYQNHNERGLPSLSWKITNGVISLEFKQDRLAHPSLEGLKNEIASLEIFAFELIMMNKLITQTYTELNKDE
jgi:hypothetical protein